MGSGSGIFSQIFSRMQTAVSSRITPIFRAVQNVQNVFNNLIQKIQEKFTKFIKIMISKPKSKADYFRIAGIYFAKKLVFMSSFILVAMGYLFVRIIIPNLEGKLWYAKFSINSKKSQQFEGKAKVYDMDGNFIYKGNIKSGSPDGFGIQYDQNGNIIYKGNFGMGKYNGSGEIYDSSGHLVYSGNFESNKYEGSGKMLNNLGKVIYVGNFEKGLKSGKGTEYDPKSGLKKYYGEFKNGKYEGKGLFYDSDGSTLVYEGDYKDGLFDGSGKKYQNGNLIYDGNFKSGKYDGLGILYDESSRNIIYSGKFSEGLYNGEGDLYDPKSSNVIYSGEFKDGKKDGKGILYDKLGIPVFTGEFKNNMIDYMNNFGLSLNEILDKFGRCTCEKSIGNIKMLLYDSIDGVLIFIKNSDGEYIFEKVIIGTKNDFMGLGNESSASERRNVLGQAYVSIFYSLNQNQKQAFSLLRINIQNSSSIPTDKYIFENYFIRFYFNNDKSRICAIEIGRL